MIISDSIPFPFLFMCFLRVSKHYIINNQGRSQTSEQDEASLERRRREPLGESGGMPPEKILKSRGSEMLF